MKIEKKTKDMKPKRIRLKERVFCPVLIFSFCPCKFGYSLMKKMHKIWKTVKKRKEAPLDTLVVRMKMIVVYRMSPW